MAFKRFLVIDLFNKGKSFEVKEWVDVEKELPKERSGIYKVKLNNGNECIAYFCNDMCCNLMQYFNKPLSYWWDKETKEPLYNVTHWGK